MKATKITSFEAVFSCMHPPVLFGLGEVQGHESRDKTRISNCSMVQREVREVKLLNSPYTPC